MMMTNKDIASIFLWLSIVMLGTCIVVAAWLFAIYAGICTGLAYKMYKDQS